MVTDNPFVATGIAIGYYALLLLFRTTRRIATPAASHWSEQLSIRLLELSENFIPYREYPHQYRKYISTRFGYLHTEGTSVPRSVALRLQPVFVGLNLAPRPPDRILSTPIRGRSSSVQPSSSSIWDYLTSDNPSTQHLAILGPRGSGKTTLLKQLANVLAKTEKEHLHVSLKDKLPILLHLADCAEYLKNEPDLAPELLIAQDIKRHGGASPPRAWLATRLQSDSFVILLDGLDEVTDATARNRVRTWLKRHVLSHGSSKVLLASRPHGYEDFQLIGVTVLEVLPFTAAQAHQFVMNWIREHETINARL